MNIILLSGGSGTRLWPVSGDVRSKQFVKLFKNQDGEYESMVQRMYAAIRRVDPEARVTIATAKAQVPLIREQLGDAVGISVEPCRRDTFPAIALASLYLHDVLGAADSEPVVVCPVDPYVEDDYFEALKRLSELAEEGRGKLVLMGMEPTCPSEKFGYIMTEDTQQVSRVSSFKEKPDAATAADYIEQGSLWNGGIFAYRLGYLLVKAHELIDFTDYRDMYDRYDQMTRISFDYAVVEKEPDIAVLRFSGVWKDLGTWNTLTEALPERVIGPALLSEDCRDVSIINETDVPVLAMGVSNLIISVTSEGILVSSPDRADAIKPYVEKLRK